MKLQVRLMPLVSLIIPTRNEAESIFECITRAKAAFDDMNQDAEILVADNSTDGTSLIASSIGAKVLTPDRLGYGNAYLAGFKEARGQFLVLMDGDLTYDPSDIKKLLPHLFEGDFDIVIGSRLKGHILPGSMPALHRYIGNPILSWLLNRLYGSNLSDAHCGLRAITRDALNSLTLRSGGMEFASEMLIEASRKGLRIAEVPIAYYPRKGQSKLLSFSDGWRHLRFMMLYRPIPFLLFPGGVAFVVGLVLTVAVYIQGGMRMHSLILGILLLLMGYQMLLAGLYFGAFGASYGLSSSGIIKNLMHYHSLEKELLFGVFLLVVGIILGLKVLFDWSVLGFGSLSEVQNAMISLILSILGLQTIFSGLFMSLLMLHNGHQDD
jgi:glycosyltransferase involved in cell wall biosynthesis